MNLAFEWDNNKALINLKNHKNSNYADDKTSYFVVILEKFVFKRTKKGYLEQLKMQRIHSQEYHLSCPQNLSKV
jgi:hypothetical protein